MRPLAAQDVEERLPQRSPPIVIFPSKFHNQNSNQMPIEVGIWKLGQTLQRVRMTSLDSESRLENYLCEDLSILAPDLMLIGRQIPTDFGKFIDLLAMDADGNVMVIELKRDRTPREVVAQILDYASWVQNLSYDEIAGLYSDKNEGRALEEGFAECFDTNPPEKLNESHRLVIVSTELDPATERIINYLADNFGVPINAIFFRCFKDDQDVYLARTWLIDPQEVEAKASRAVKKKDREPWNGLDYYVSFGDGSASGEGVYRSWDDARMYGFISAGGGTWYSKPLEKLFPGARIFVYVPKHGYVGVGKVIESAVSITEFTVKHNGVEMPFLKAPRSAEDPEAIKANASDPEKRELMVRVEWTKAVPKQQGFWEKGMFASQLPACRLRNQFTLERLIQHFGLEE